MNGDEIVAQVKNRMLSGVGLDDVSDYVTRSIVMFTLNTLEDAGLIHGPHL
jgi:hypothetical protein